MTEATYHTHTVEPRAVHTPGLFSPLHQPPALLSYRTPKDRSPAVPPFSLWRGIALTPNPSLHCQQLPQIWWCGPHPSQPHFSQIRRTKKLTEPKRPVGHHQAYQYMPNRNPRRREATGAERIVKEIMSPKLSNTDGRHKYTHPRISMNSSRIYTEIYTKIYYHQTHTTSSVQASATCHLISHLHIQQ